MRLPATLAPWRQWLDWFDPEPAAALGELLLRLHPLLGAFRLRALRGQVEPEGIDDLRRRGSYERLLLSEWALADAAPEEFDRRAAGGEHLFLSPKLIARQTDALTVAVFDSGPAQLGAPRLLHIALWILLAQRAQAAKARFLWGVLGIPGELHAAGHAGDPTQSLRELLDARAWRFRAEANFAEAGHSGTGAARAMLEQQWAQWLDAQQPSPGERWSIGAAAAGYGLGHRVAIAAAGAGELAVTVSSPQARREARLALPDPKRASRLLRGQFVLKPQVAPATEEIGPVRVVRVAERISLKQPPLLSANGLSVAVPLWDKQVVHLHRLTSKRRLGNPSVVHWTGPLFAAGIHAHVFGGVVAYSRPRAHPGAYPDGAPLPALSFQGLRGFVQGVRPELLNCSPDRGRWAPMAWVQASARELGGRAEPKPELFVLDSGNLWRWRPQDSDGDPAKFAPYAQQVLAMVAMHEAWVDYLRVRDGRIEVATTQPGRANRNDRALAEAKCPGQIQSGWLHGQRVRGGYRHVAAVELRLGGHGGERSALWRLLQWDGGDIAADFELILPSEWKVIGIDAPRDGGPALIAINPDRSAVLAIGENERRTLYQSSIRLTVGSVAAGGETIAVIDLRGRLVVLHERGVSTTIYAGGSDAEGDGDV